jgi:hypothetical protein
MTKAQVILSIIESIQKKQDEGAGAKAVGAGAAGTGIYMAAKAAGKAGAKHLDTIEQKRRQAMALIGKE